MEYIDGSNQLFLKTPQDFLQKTFNFIILILVIKFLQQKIVQQCFQEH